MITDTGWNRDAACGLSGHDPDLWAYPHPLERALAKHVCERHCPVLDRCRAEVEPAAGMVIGGIAYDTRTPLKPAPTRASGAACPTCHPGLRAWVRPAEPPLEPLLPLIDPEVSDQMCGTRARYCQHIRAGEKPDEACAEANRVYQRGRQAVRLRRSWDTYLPVTAAGVGP